MWSRTHAPKPLVDPDKLQFCIENGLNVLLTGRHGVGKTSIVQRAFERAGKRLLVFSGATMDPWVDFVGVPRPLLRPDGSTVLELIRRAELADDAVDAIFIDEFNRAPSKVRNAAMEILQFKSVNGHRFSRLKAVWAAINPGEGTEYDTEELDPAQRDRFQIQLAVPYRPCPQYFTEKYGVVGKGALEWWDGLSDTAKNEVSPRRLDYAVAVVQYGGDVRDVLPDGSNPKKLLKLLKEGPIFDRLRDLLKANDRVGAKNLMQDPNTGSEALRHILGSKAASIFFLPLLDRERLASLMMNPQVLDTVVRYSENVPEFSDALMGLSSAAGNEALLKKAEQLARKHGVSFSSSVQPTLVSPLSPLNADQVAALDPYGRIAT